MDPEFFERRIRWTPGDQGEGFIFFLPFLLSKRVERTEWKTGGTIRTRRKRK